jgi:hypothetical protein
MRFLSSDLYTHFIVLLVALISLRRSFVAGFSKNSLAKTVYDVPDSGWNSNEWNWGSAAGTGHDCAAICRRKYTTRKERSKLVDELVGASSRHARDRHPQNFEEVKLILALAWQRGRWDGSDGGPGGYGEVLAALAGARRYERGDEDECSINLIQDMQDRFRLLNPQDEDLEMMENFFALEPDIDAIRRCCSGLVLKAMGFIENGL